MMWWMKDISPGGKRGRKQVGELCHNNEGSLLLTTDYYYYYYYCYYYYSPGSLTRSAKMYPTTASIAKRECLISASC